MAASSDLNQSGRRFVWQDNAENILVFALPFLVGTGSRLDGALVFCVLSLIFFLVLPLVMQAVQDLFSSRVLISLSLILSGGFAAALDFLVSWLMPGTWSQIHLYLPLMAGSPLLIYPLADFSTTGLGDKTGGSLKRWAILSFLLILSAFVREILGTGGIALDFGPGMESGFSLIPDWIFSMPVLVMAPFVFFLVGFILMVRQHFLSAKKDGKADPAVVGGAEQ